MKNMYHSYTKAATAISASISETARSSAEETYGKEERAKDELI